MSNIIESKKFILSEASSNNNKWWEVILYDNNDVITNWARVGYNPQSKTFPGVGKSFVESKIKEKIKKGYSEAKVLESVSTGSFSGNSTTKIVSNNSLHEIAKSQLLKSSKNPILDRLIDRLVKSNVHKITSNTNITLNDVTGLFQTPIGIITPDGISDARNLLVEIMDLVKISKYTTKLDNLTSQYLRLIPQNIGMKFDVKNIFPDILSIQKQNDILDSLESSYQAITTTKPKIDLVGGNPNKTVERVFDVDFDVENGPDADRLEKWYESSKKSKHGYDHIKVKNIFKIKIHQMNDSFKDDNSKETFHGTSEANCLSILKSGLKVSPPSTAAIAGKMWGNGAYGAINSSKSLGYTFGRWGQSSGESGWLFICKFSMGKIHYPKGYGNCSKPPIGYNSVWATVANTGLQHDELIVYENNRINITHLIECK